MKPPQRAMPISADNGDLNDLADALKSYLAELDTYRVVCQRHNTSGAIREEDGVLRLSRWFALGKQTVDYLRTGIGRLRGWEETPHWPTEGIAWEGLLRAARGEGSHDGRR